MEPDEMSPEEESHYRAELLADAEAAERSAAEYDAMTQAERDALPTTDEF